MRYYRRVGSRGPHLIARSLDKAYDLTSVHDELRSVTDLLSAAKLTGERIDELVEPLIARAETVAINDVESNAALPIIPEEVWAAGVTYEISEQAREEESVLPEVYRNVFHHERPEIFLKATPNRTVGPSESIGVREDSNWNVPEPELAVVLYHGAIVGYTIGNDVSSREIEGENPLYLPQAKVYDRCCSIGPCFVSSSTIPDPHDLDLSMEIERAGEPIFAGTTSTAEMVRTCEELVSFLRRSNVLPSVAVLLTGTSLVPPEEVSLQVDDTVRIEVESIGTLENPVVSV